jgi:phosphoglycolate phosphatase
MADNNRFDLLIFDFDGTLCDTRSAIAHCLERALARYGRPIPPPKQTASIVSQGFSLAETLSLLDPGLCGQGGVIDEMISAYRSFYASEGDPLVEAFAGTKAALQSVDALGVKCIVVSNKGVDAIHRSLERYGLAPFIDRVFGDQPGVPFKPDPALLTDHIAPRFPHIAKARILMIGDTEVDIRFARASGIACCWAAYGFGNPQGCMALSPRYIIENVEQLSAVVSS